MANSKIKKYSKALRNGQFQNKKIILKYRIWYFLDMSSEIGAN
jgi:hypothetical protein